MTGYHSNGVKSGLHRSSHALTGLGGIATAQSLHSCPCATVRSFASGPPSLIPTQTMYESTSFVTCSTRAGRPGVFDARYLVVIVIGGPPVVPASAMLLS